MAAEELHDALDRGFATHATVRDAAIDPDAPEVLLAYARQVVDDDPEGAACAIFATVVEMSDSDAETANLAWLFEEWKRRKRDEVERRRGEAERRRGEEGD